LWTKDQPNFPLNKDEWYQQRDDRTNRMEGIEKIDEISIGIIVSPSVEYDYSTQVMCLVTANILARWCRKIKFEIFPSDSLLPIQHGNNFKNLIQQMMNEIDPHGQFDFGDVNETEHDFILVIGHIDKNMDEPYTWIDGYGWIGGFGYGKSIKKINQSKQEFNPIGPSFASCLGVAELFRQSIGISSQKQYVRWFSLFDFNCDETNPESLNNPSFNKEFNFGTIHQIGCGAVGSSLDFLLSLTEWTGAIHLIDYDNVEYTNCNRSLSFTARDASSKTLKVDSCNNALINSKIDSIPYADEYSKFVSQGHYKRYPPDLILCLANEKKIWSTIQHNYPSLVYHATTTPNWGINFGRHIPKKEWCILCRFSNEIKSDLIPPCSEGIISKNESQNKDVYGVLPFLSPTAAILILGEIVKLNLDDYPINDNFVQLSMKSPNGQFSKLQRGPMGDCICNTQSLDVYLDEIIKTKYWYLTKG